MSAPGRVGLNGEQVQLTNLPETPDSSPAPWNEALEDVCERLAQINGFSPLHDQREVLRVALEAAHREGRDRPARALKEIQSEIDRGKTKRCIGCCDGNDIPQETLCRACWRIWIGNKMYLLWDWPATESTIARALKETEK